MAKGETTEIRGCGCGSEEVEIIRPAIPTAFFDGPNYLLCMSYLLKCSCGKMGACHLRESGHGVVFNVSWLEHSPIKKVDALPIIEWPKEMERIAVEWAMELESKK